ncbi:hypothetical protein [Streptomyces sp. NPDC001068]|uniref:hypothetical protein n=1 Tax=Streptomyces sp. NPDC001068 TaxID=3364544 RepID=UPI0036C91B15
MFRGTTARTVFSLPAATPLAVQIFAPAATFATAHTLSHVKAKAPSGPRASVTLVRDDPPALRDRGPHAYRPGTARHTGAIPTPAARRDRSPGTSRTRSSAALQVLCR